MEIIRGLHNLSGLKGCVITIGNFDGVHLGHQSIILRALEVSKSLNIPLLVMSFLPTPQAFFNKPKPSLSSFKEKHLMLEKIGVDKHLIVNFNLSFSEITAEDFINKILVNRLNIRHCIIGDDFRFGKNRKGGLKMLESCSSKHQFATESSSSILYNQKRISSSKIRRLLASGDFLQASKLLGRKFSIEGKVIHGNKKGRTIGFPTINVPIKRKISPILGVFAVTVEIDGQSHYGVCNLGKRPTIGGEHTLLEVYVFNFSKEAYGKDAKVIFNSKIRDEKKFESFADLKTQIELDTKKARDYFGI
jgi:riboflavin kinase/FMN adenylyltransferase